jgi:hypothetical protein
VKCRDVDKLRNKQLLKKVCAASGRLLRVHMEGKKVTKGNWNTQVRGQRKGRTGSALRYADDRGPTDLKEVAYRRAVTKLLLCWAAGRRAEDVSTAARSVAQARITATLAFCPQVSLNWASCVKQECFFRYLNYMGKVP